MLLLAEVDLGDVLLGVFVVDVLLAGALNSCENSGLGVVVDVALVIALVVVRGFIPSFY